MSEWSQNLDHKNKWHVSGEMWKGHVTCEREIYIWCESERNVNFVFSQCDEEKRQWPYTINLHVLFIFNIRLHHFVVWAALVMSILTCKLYIFILKFLSLSLSLYTHPSTICNTNCVYISLNRPNGPKYFILLGHNRFFFPASTPTRGSEEASLRIPSDLQDFPINFCEHEFVRNRKKILNPRRWWTNRR